MRTQRIEWRTSALGEDRMGFVGETVAFLLHPWPSRQKEGTLLHFLWTGFRVSSGSSFTEARQQAEILLAEFLVDTGLVVREEKTARG